MGVTGAVSDLDRAKDLIRQKDYTQARVVLSRISNDPTARRWLDKLDEIDPPPKPVRRSGISPAFLALACVLCLLIGGGVGFALARLVPSAALTAQTSNPQLEAARRSLYIRCTSEADENILEPPLYVDGQINPNYGTEYQRLIDEEISQCKATFDLLINILPDGVANCAEQFDVFTQEEQFGACLQVAGIEDAITLAAPTFEALNTQTAVARTGTPSP